MNGQTSLLDRWVAGEEGAILPAEFLNHLPAYLARLPAKEREIFQLRLQGRHNQEIARQLDYYERYVRRVLLDRIRKFAEREGLAF
jgi:DNA-binding NarL/FixJ family response regulator